ncbi:MAG: RidA family protein [Burkholderiaceae bacterium]|jgi:enamine deaminase RidA (YjgF/YER057c/UK114 family)|nr:RidA family protein [Burkholderiaceae bacterium]MDP4919570.1 RidA family protein [Burkholderiaceae bacterium]MDP4949518.1 RidA family protein [Burkholderiaceae bacterium]MDP5127495.1 RidA family protein [Burkholderiaceae bacterium]
MSRITERLKELGIELPIPLQPLANYVPYRWSGSLLFISGQVPVQNGTLPYLGKVGVDLSIEQGQAAARLCAINILAQVNAALNGNLDHVNACLKLGGFVNCAPDFSDQPTVINGASDFMVDVFGDKGRHARAAVGSNALPRNVAVEVDAIFDCQPPK